MRTKRDIPIIVCYEDRMIQIDLNWDVTDADIEKVKEFMKDIALKLVQELKLD